MTKIKKAADDKKKYPVTECFNIIKGLWADPKYTEMVIQKEAYVKLMCFINLIGDYEISGFGRIQELDWTIDGHKKTLPTITDFDIIRQEVKAAYVESDEDAVLEFIRKIPTDQRDEWILDWHSHVEMATSPSGTDWNNYEEMLKARMNNQFPIMIVNKRESITLKQYISANKHPDIKVLYDNKHLSDDILLKLYNECKEKVENLCTRYVAPATTKVSYFSRVGKQDTNKTMSDWYTRNYRTNQRDEDDWDDYGTYGYGYNYTTAQEDYDAEDDEIKNAKKEGYEFQDVLICEECGKDLDPTDANQVAWHLCNDCLQSYVVPQDV